MSQKSIKLLKSNKEDISLKKQNKQKQKKKKKKRKKKNISQ